MNAPVTGTNPSGDDPVIRSARWVLWPSVAIAGAFTAMAILWPRSMESVFKSVQSVIVNDLGWYYVLLVAGIVLFAIVLAASRLGDIKLGRNDDEPEFSNFSWMSMLFAAGMGIGLVFYGAAEPLSHFVNPRPGVTGTPESLAQQAITQTYVHWGFHAWSIYAVVGVALAYAVHRRRRPISIRYALEPLLGRHIHSGWGNLIDVIAVIGTLFGVATSLGLGVLQISAGLDHAGIINPSTTVQIILIVVVTGLAIFSLVSGVHKGMKWLSNANLIMAGLLLVAVLVTGPTLFILRDFVQSFGNYFQNVIGLTFNVSAFQGAAGESWQSSWTTFYWGWWISWAPFVGVFIARISKGRTVRQFIVGVLLVPTIMTFLWFAVLGGTAIVLAMTGNEQGFLTADGTVDVNTALFAMLEHLPGGSFLTIGSILLIIMFFVTSADSGSLVIGMITSGGATEPSRKVRVLWAIVVAALGASLLLAGGLQSMQTAAIITALPFSIVVILMCFATWKALSSEVRARKRAEERLLTQSVSDQVTGQLTEQFADVFTEVSSDEPRPRHRVTFRLSRKRGMPNSEE